MVCNLVSLLPRDSIYMYSIYVFREIHERALGGFSGGRRPASALFLGFHVLAVLSSFMYRKLAKGYIVCSVN